MRQGHGRRAMKLHEPEPLPANSGCPLLPLSLDYRHFVNLPGRIGSSMKIDANDFRVREDHKVILDKWPTTVDPVYKSKSHYKELLAHAVDELSEQQQLLYASDSFAMLLIFQAMDAAGKDGVIRHVMSGINPQ
jgi:polyphosphate kinase 2 (PPK2 family)